MNEQEKILNTLAAWLYGRVTAAVSMYGPELVEEIIDSRDPELIDQMMDGKLTDYKGLKILVTPP